MFKTRVISSVFLVAIALVTILLGGPVLIITVAAISLIGMQELYNAMGVVKTDNRPGNRNAGKTDPAGQSGDGNAVKTNPAGQSGDGNAVKTNPAGQSGDGNAVKTNPAGQSGDGNAVKTNPAGQSGDENAVKTNPAGRSGDGNDEKINPVSQPDEKNIPEDKKLSQKFNILTVMGFAGALGYDAVIFFCPEPYYLVGVVASLTLVLMVYVFTFPRFQAEEVMTVFFGVVYVAVMLGFIYVTRMGANGIILVWLIFLSSWGADTCAYLVGRKLGKHKMAPVLSPKKSIEGAIGGVVGAGIFGLIFGFLFRQPAGRYFVICAAGALISMVGDLAASAIKRDKEIKDYGKLIPGHGGILDRFDSVIFTAPVIYFLSLLLIGAK